MNLYTLLQAFLTLHLTGLVLMAGTVLMDNRLYSAFWQQLTVDREKSRYLLDTAASVSRVTGVGVGLLIVTGVGMMAVTNGIFGEQVWFRIKFGLVLLLLALTWIARRRGVKLRAIMDQSDAHSLAIVTSTKRFLSRYFLMAYLIFFLIGVLSVFKFN